MTSDDREYTEASIYGVWYPDHSQSSNDALVFRREPPNRWGPRLEFQENGMLKDAYSAPCGNDYSIHLWSGQWLLDKDQGLLLMRIDKVDFAGYMTSQPCNPPDDYKTGRKY